MGVPYRAYHGDTTIGIPETQDYVREICALFDWNLNIRKPPNRDWWYDRMVEKHGFPGASKTSHKIMYRYLKERALRRFITHEVKSTPMARENVLLITGIRKSESAIRMGYSETTKKENSRIWCAPIFHWSEDDCKAYMKANDVPKNPVKERICISGECLCGAFAGKEEYSEIKAAYPHVARIIEELHERAKASGHPWEWSSGPKEWRKDELKKMQLSMNFMCIGCETERDTIYENKQSAAP